ncbi:MAG: TolC family protein [Bacteroidota bacterium]|nr:TolC family protein [Bacteroidota bacterium]
MSYKNIVLPLFLLMISAEIMAQPRLSIDDAVALALKNNYDILLSQNDAAIDKVNNTAGNAGMLPSLSVNGGDNFALNDIRQKPSSGNIVNYNGQRANVLNASVALNWTVYDGGRMFVTKNKLNEIENLGQLLFKDRVQQTVYNVIAAYYDVVRQKQQLMSINEVITYNKERVKILQTSFDAGLTAKTNLLQAKIDLNVYQENAINQQTVILSSKRSLSLLLNRNADSVFFDVSDTIPLNYTPDKTTLIQKLYASNTSVLTAQKEMDIARLSLKEFNSLYLPKVSLNTGYNFSKTNNSVGSILENRSMGPLIGGSVSIPIFQGGNVKRQVSVARIQLQSAEYSLESTKNAINVQLQNALTAYENQQQLLTIEKDNVTLARENLDISMQRLRYGQTTSLEVHLAQESYEDSRTRLLNFQYNLKIAETRLKQLMAGL